MHACINVCTHACMHKCMYVCMYLCMYGCLSWWYDAWELHAAMVAMVRVLMVRLAYLETFQGGRCCYCCFWPSFVVDWAVRSGACWYVCLSLVWLNLGVSPWWIDHKQDWIAWFDKLTLTEGAALEKLLSRWWCEFCHVDSIDSIWLPERVDRPTTYLLLAAGRNVIIKYLQGGRQV